MKKIKILTMLPALLMCACTNVEKETISDTSNKSVPLSSYSYLFSPDTAPISGTVKEITYEQATPYIDQIKANIGLDRTIDISIEHFWNSGKGDSALSSLMVFRMKKNLDTGEEYYHQEGILSYSTVSGRYLDYYKVNDATKGQAEYMKYRAEKDDPFVYSSTATGADSSSFTSKKQECYSYIEELYNYVSIIDNYTYPSSAEVNNLYSNGADYFKCVSGYGTLGTYPEGISDDDEIQYYKRYTGEYRNGLLTCFDMIWDTTYGNQSYARVSIKYTNVDVELPTGWETTLSK